jgi:hypothetical protein
LLDGEIFYILREAQIIVGEWVKHYNHDRSLSALAYRTPAPQTTHPNSAKLIYLAAMIYYRKTFSSSGPKLTAVKDFRRLVLIDLVSILQ